MSKVSVRERFMQLLPKKIIPTWEVKNTKFEISPLGGYDTHLVALQLARAIYGPKIPTWFTKKSQLYVVTLRSILREVTT